MARQQIQPQPANLSIAQIQIALPKLMRRLDEVNTFSPEDAASAEEDSKGKDILLRIDSTLIEVFGHNTLEYNRYRITSFYYNGVIVLGGRGGPSYAELLESYSRGKRDAVTKLESAISTLKETLEDSSGSVAGLTPLILDRCDLSPVIKTACSSLYKDQHYANAVETACKVLNAQVQAKSGRYDQGDTALMELVFSVNAPILVFNDLADKHDQGEQQGMMSLYKGVFLAFRNQRAHKLIEDDQATAFGAINMIDFLIKMLDKATKNVS